MLTDNIVRFAFYFDDFGCSMSIVGQNGPSIDDNPKLVDILCCDNWNEAKAHCVYMFGLGSYTPIVPNIYYRWTNGKIEVYELNDKTTSNKDL